MRYLSVCSGIEAATIAWQPLGWTAQAYSEIEPFPCAVLHERYSSCRPRFMPDPDAPGLKPKERKARAAAIKAVAALPKHANGPPNLGDMTRFKDWPDADVDVLVGGTPCQSFSVAGLRKGLDDPRGNLCLTYLAILDRYRPAWCIWENVPGVLSSDEGRDFGTFLGGLGQLGYGFAYRVLDAQYVRVDGFGWAVPQRRRRVFVVGHLGDWRCAAAVLFEPESLQGNPAPRRQAGQGIARPIGAGSPRGSGYRNDADTVENLVAFGGNDTSGPIDVATARNAHGWPHGRLDFESETFVVAPPVTSNPYGDHESREGLLVAHALRADGFDASEDGTGRGTPLVPICFQSNASGDNLSFDHDLSFTLKAGADSGWANAPAVALPYTLAIRGRDETHQLEYRQDGTANAVLTPNGGRAGIGVGAVCYDDYNQTLSDVAHTVVKGRDNRQPHAFDGWAVRRLMPVECERLQAFPDGYTLIPYRGKPASDGPRYKALGNSMAVNCMRWLGRRIAMVSALERRV